MYFTVHKVANGHAQHYRVLFVFMHLIKQQPKNHPVTDTAAYLHTAPNPRLRLGEQKPGILKNAHIQGSSRGRKTELFGDFIYTETALIEKLKDVDPRLIGDSLGNDQHLLLIGVIKQYILQHHYLPSSIVELWMKPQEIPRQRSNLHNRTDITMEDLFRHNFIGMELVIHRIQVLMLQCNMLE